VAAVTVWSAARGVVTAAVTVGPVSGLGRFWDRWARGAVESRQGRSRPRRRPVNGSAGPGGPWRRRQACSARDAGRCSPCASSATVRIAVRFSVRIALWPAAVVRITSRPQRAVLELRKGNLHALGMTGAVTADVTADVTWAGHVGHWDQCRCVDVGHPGHVDHGWALRAVRRQPGASLSGLVGHGRSPAVSGQRQLGAHVPAPVGGPRRPLFSEGNPERSGGAPGACGPRAGASLGRDRGCSTLGCCLVG
jgi:hypothetical protein